MKVLVTLDYYDGRESKSVETDLEGLDMQSFVYSLMSACVCGFTVSKIGNLTKQVEKSKAP